MIEQENTKAPFPLPSRARVEAVATGQLIGLYYVIKRRDGPNQAKTPNSFSRVIMLINVSGLPFPCSAKVVGHRPCRSAVAGAASFDSSVSETGGDGLDLKIVCGPASISLPPILLPARHCMPFRGTQTENIKDPETFSMSSARCLFRPQAAVCRLPVRDFLAPALATSRRRPLSTTITRAAASDDTATQADPLPQAKLPLKRKPLTNEQRELLSSAVSPTGCSAVQLPFSFPPL